MIIQAPYITSSLQVNLPPMGTTENKIIVIDDTGSFKYRTDLSLQGTQGITGAQGTQGTTGIQGTQGLQGIQGVSSFVSASNGLQLSSSILLWGDTSSGSSGPAKLTHHTFINQSGSNVSFVGRREVSQSILTITSESRLVIGEPSSSMGLLNIKQNYTINYNERKPSIYIEGLRNERDDNGHFVFLADDTVITDDPSKFGPFFLQTAWSNQSNLPGDADGNMLHILGWVLSNDVKGCLTWEQRYNPFATDPMDDVNTQAEFYYEARNVAGVPFRPFGCSHTREGQAGFGIQANFTELKFPPVVPSNPSLSGSIYARESYETGVMTYYYEHIISLAFESTSSVIEKKMPLGGGVESILLVDSDARTLLGSNEGIRTKKELLFDDTGTRPKISSANIIDFNQGIQVNNPSTDYHIQLLRGANRGQVYVESGRLSLGFNDDAAGFSMNTVNKVKIGAGANGSAYFDLTFTPISTGSDGAFAIYDNVGSLYTRLETLPTGEFQIANASNTTKLLVNRIEASSVTASLQGTASYASMALSASWAPNNSLPAGLISSSAQIASDISGSQYWKPTGSSDINYSAGNVKINGGSTGGNTGTEGLYKLQIKMGDAPGYGFTVSNGDIDPWFHINSNGIGFVGDGTTIPYWSIESDVLYTRELRAHIVPAGDYSYIFAKGISGSRNDFQVWANKDIVLQTGRANDASPLGGAIWAQATNGFHFVDYASLTNANATTIDQVGGGARLYQFDASQNLKNLFQANGISYINGGNVGINQSNPIYKLDVSGSGNYSHGLIVSGSLVSPSATGSFSGSHHGNGSGLTGIASASYAATASFAQRIISNPLMSQIFS